MARKETVEEFVKNLKGSSSFLQSMAMNSWDQATVEALGTMKLLAPESNFQTLVKSMSNVKARITPRGLESFLVARVPYAKMLNRGTTVINGDEVKIQLKNAGETSYYVAGSAIKKKKKGVIGFADKARDNNADLFVSGLKRVISKWWRKI